MPTTNDFKHLANGVSANVLDQATFAALSTLLGNGFTSGIVNSQQFNKVLRQATTMAYVVAEFIRTQANVDVLDNGTPATIVTNMAAAVNALIAAAPTVVRQAMVVSDQKSSGTHGGASTSGVQTRTLNTVESNTISGASLTSNQVTLPAGTYSVIGIVPAGNVSSHRARLYNATDSANIILGSSENATNGAVSDLVDTNSIIVGRFTLAASKAIEVRHYTAQAESTWGLGNAVSEAGVNEVYTRLFITKES